ncbi:MAG: ABC transporter ATP-binding protein [Actinobacteria bacterium]|jgi:multiple sugar transport system ATP-binding protein|nr:ABC transporter ATP-binding protein [Actinomycetota bacterium]
MSSVVFDHVSKVFDGTVAVDGLDLTIHDQEFMVLLGPSGCGKTTALRMIAGLETVTSGTLSIGDRVVNDIPASDRDIAMVFQSYALYPHMTVRKNIESPLVAHRGRRVDAAERERRVREAADILGLGDYLERKPGALSGGQRQRVALARAIVRRPEVFLMDEPLSNLDAKLRTQTRTEIVELHRRLGSTFVYVTHDQVEAMTMATRVAVIANGRLQQTGTPDEVYRRPANLFVATFIGSPPMNVIRGVARDNGAGLELAAAAGTLTWSTPVSAVGIGSELVAAIRPEHLHVDPAGTLDFTVRAIEQLGHERHLLGRSGDADVVVRQSSADAPIAIGESLRLRPDPAEVHLFDPATEARVD